MRLLTIAALLTTAATLQACTHAEHAHSEAIFTALGAPLPAGLAEEPVNETPEIEQIVPDVSPPPPPPQYGEPGYVAAYGEKGYTGPEPCPGSQFRILTCDDNGQDWHWLGPNMEWLN